MRDRATVAILLALACSLASAEVVDRLAVTVNKQVITERQILQDLRITAFIDQRKPDFSGPAKRRAAERMVDQILIRQEAADNRAVPPAPEEAGLLLTRVKEEYKTQAEYQAALLRYGVAEDEVRAHLLAGFTALRYSADRFRLEVEIGEQDLREYYEKMLREQAPSAGVVPSFEASRAQLEKLLREERSTEALDRWLLMARAEAQIVYRARVFQ